jgi:hypothetical protein
LLDPNRCCGRVTLRGCGRAFLFHECEDTRRRRRSMLKLHGRYHCDRARRWSLHQVRDILEMIDAMFGAIFVYRILRGVPAIYA